MSRDNIKILLRPGLRTLWPTGKFSDEEQEDYKKRWACSREQLYEKRHASERWRLVRSYRRNWCEKINWEGYGQYVSLWDEVMYEGYINNRLVWRTLKRAKTKRDFMRGRRCPKSRIRINRKKND